MSLSQSLSLITNAKYGNIVQTFLRCWLQRMGILMMW